MPSSSKNFDLDSKSKETYMSNLDSFDGKTKNKRNEALNSSRRYSEGSAQRSNLSVQPSGSRFTTTLVTEENLPPGTSSERKCNNNAPADAPLVTRASNKTVKPGFTISDD